MMHETHGSNAKIRDTTKSGLVTDMLMAILAALGTGLTSSETYRGQCPREQLSSTSETVIFLACAACYWSEQSS